MPGRSASELVGSRLAFAVEPEGNPRTLDAARYTLALLGHDYPARTPAMWNACYDRFGLAFRNVAMLCRVADLEDVLRVLRADDRYAGGGIGVGLKREVLRHLDRLEPLAEVAGAVNLVQKNPDGSLAGHNTDGEGWVRSLEEALAATGRSLVGLRVIILGAGGTGRSIALALARRGADSVVLNRTPQRAVELAARVNRFVGRAACRGGAEAELAAEAPSAAVVVNTTTKGSSGPLEAYAALAAAPVPVTEEHVQENREASRRLLGSLPRDTIVSDVVLRDGPTPTLALAREVGLPLLDGVGMVVQQGAEAFWRLHAAELQPAGVTQAEVASEMGKATA